MISIPKMALLVLAAWQIGATVQPAPARPAPAMAAADAADLSTPEHAIAEFIAALNALDRDRYAAMFTDDASLFFTGPPFPLRRVQGRAQIMAYVGPLFDSARARGARQGDVRPADLLFQTWGDTSVVTFHIPAGQDLDRRTFVLRRSGGRWRIVHLHASAAREAAAVAPAGP
jgi:uncharacterized protein (TIGR02246 family)